MEVELLLKQEEMPQKKAMNHSSDFKGNCRRISVNQLELNWSDEVDLRSQRILVSCVLT